MEGEVKSVSSEIHMSEGIIVLTELYGYESWALNLREKKCGYIGIGNEMPQDDMGCEEGQSCKE